MNVDTREIAAGVRSKTIELANLGIAPAEIANILGIPLSIVKVWAEVAKPKQKNYQRKAEMLKLRESGMTDVEIAAQFGISKQRVGMYIGPRNKLKKKAEVHPAIGMTRETHDRLREIAASFGLFSEKGQYAKNPSMAHLLEKIGSGELIVVKPRMFDQELMIPKDTKPSRDP